MKSGKYENKKKLNKQKKSLYSKEENNSLGEDDSDNDRRELLFMALDEELENENYEDEVDPEVC